MEMKTLRCDTLRDRIRNEDIRNIREIQDVNWSDGNRLAKIAKHGKHPPDHLELRNVGAKIVHQHEQENRLDKVQDVFYKKKKKKRKRKESNFHF